MKSAYLLFVVFLLGGCFHETCETKERRIETADFNMVITKSYDKYHARWIVGMNENHMLDTFKYYSFQYLTELAQPGSRFIKHKGETIFTVQHGNLSYILKWDCSRGGGLLRVDTIKPN